MSLLGMAHSNFASRFSLFAGIAGSFFQTAPKVWSNKLRPAQSAFADCMQQLLWRPRPHGFSTFHLCHLASTEPAFRLKKWDQLSFWGRMVGNTSLLNPYSGEGGYWWWFVPCYLAIRQPPWLYHAFFWQRGHLWKRQVELVIPRLFRCIGVQRLDFWKSWMASIRPKGILKPHAMLKRL